MQLASAFVAGAQPAQVVQPGERALHDPPLALFIGRACAALRRTPNCFGEVLRQAGILLTGSALVLVSMQLVIGGGLFTAYAGRSFEVSGATGLSTMICDVQEMFPYVFGYILVAKVGCGLVVAEIGSMRISEETGSPTSTRGPVTRRTTHV